MRFSNDPAQIGTKLGPKLVHLVSQAIVSTKVRLLDVEHRARVHSMQTIIDRAGHEVADLYRPIWQKSMASQDMPDHVREHMEAIVSGTHQWQALAGLALGTTGASSSLSTILSNTLAPLVRKAVAAEPELIPGPDELIQLGVKGAMDWPAIRDFCRGQGWNDDIIVAVRNAVTQYPPLAETLELTRRHLLNPGDAELFLTRNGIPQELHPALLALARVPLSPADLADMVVRGIKTHAEAAAIAAESGVDATDFAALVLDTGEPPGLQQMLEGYRRGFIDRATLEKGIRQSRYRDEWIPLLEQLRFSPMSVADAVNAVVQNHLTPQQGEAISQLNGLEPGQFAILQATAGEPLSRTEMEQLYNRGLVTKEQVNQALRESRVKDKYIDLAFQLHQKVLPIFTLQKAIKAGAVDHATAVAIAMESGYSERDAGIIVSGGSADKLLPYKNKVVASIETAFEDNTIGQADAQSLIEGMGYSASEATFILTAAEFRRSARIVAQVESAVRGKYVSRHIPRGQASNDLDAIGIPATQRDFLLSLWDIELDANTRHLTEAQIVKAVHKQLIDQAEGQQRLVAMGYSIIDAQLLIEGA